MEQNLLASFIELQVPDKFRNRIDIPDPLKPFGGFHGYLTIHGEGETDGVKKIHFSSQDKKEEKIMS
jgi:hypothetical protein